MKKAKRNKEMKSLELFKKGFKKNEIVIYAIALMLVTAGYFNYTSNLDINSVETYSEEVANAESETKDNDAIQNKNIEVSKSIEEQQDNKDDESIGDAKLVNSNSVVKDGQEENNSNENKKESESSDYFIATKLERDTNYADMISTYTKILQDNSISETQKSIAMKEITKINENKNAIAICENLLSTKGFKNYAVLVNDNSINVVVEVDGDLKKEQVAQIQNIISRELKSEIENIHITEK